MIEAAQENRLRNAKSRLLFCVAFAVIGYALVCARLADLTMVQASQDTTAAHKVVPVLIREDQAPRADIIDAHGTLLASSLQVSSVYADATLVDDPAALAEKLIDILPEANRALLEKKLSSEKKFVWIYRDISPKQHYALNALGVPALNFRNEYRRFYPSGSLAAHVVGYTDIDGKGLAGLERFYDERLVQDREPLRVTLDLRVQHILREALKKSIKRFRAKGGAAVIMHAHTGALVAMISLPDFDSNHPTDTDDMTRFNRATLGVFEMGSTFKIFSTALALDKKAVSYGTYIDTKEPLKYGGFTINDYHGTKRALSVPEIFIHSSNIGTGRMVERLEPGALQGFFKDIGFFERAPIDLQERGRPLVPRPWRDINTITTSYGHGIAITPVHLVRAAAAMVNGGTLVRPHLVRDHIKKPDHSEDTRSVISAATSKKMRQLLSLTVAKGTGRNAHVDGYDVGGKTGTAEKTVKGRYVHDKLMSSFLAAFPMHDPQYIVYVALDEPQPRQDTFGYATGGWTAAPVVADVIARLGALYGMSPQPEKDGAIATSVKKYIRKDKKYASR